MPVEVKKHTIILPKVYPRYKKGNRVLLFSNTYRWGTIMKSSVKNNKHLYVVQFSDGSKPMKCYEDELLPYTSKFWWKLLGKIGIVW